MAKLNNNLLDDPIQTESCPGFSGGQRSHGAPDQLAATEAAELLNVDMGDGAACTRRGTATLGLSLPGPVRGLCWYRAPAGPVLLACAGGGLHQWDGATWAQLVAYSTAAGDPLSLAQLNGRLYLCDGVTPLQVWDSTTLAALAPGTGNPPVGSILLSAGNRLWLAGVGASPDTLFASHFLEGGAGHWDATRGVLRLGAGDVEPITGLAEWDANQIVVFKRNAIFIVTADPATTGGEDDAHSLARATVTKISDTLGCVAPQTIARVGSDIWFLSTGGVLNLGRVLSQTQRELKEAVSWPVHDIVQRINWAAVHRSSAIYRDHRYLLSLPLDDHTSPTDLLVYHTRREAWSGVWSGWEATAWAVYRSGGVERLVFGRADGSVRRWLEDVARENEVEATYQDAGANIPTSVTTRALALGEPLCAKSGLGVQVEFYASQAQAQVAVRLDEDEPIMLGGAFATSMGTLVLPLLLPAPLPVVGIRRKAFGTQGLTPFRTLQAVLSSAAGKLSVRAVAASGFVDTPRLEE